MTHRLVDTRLVELAGLLSASSDKKSTLLGIKETIRLAQTPNLRIFIAESVVQSSILD